MVILPSADPPNVVTSVPISIVSPVPVAVIRSVGVVMTCSCSNDDELSDDEFTGWQKAHPHGRRPDISGDEMPCKLDEAVYGSAAA